MAGRYNRTSAVGEASVSVSLPGAAARPSPAAALAGSDGGRAARSLLTLLQEKQDRRRSCKCREEESRKGERSE